MAFDHDRVAAAVRELLAGIGEDPDRDGLRDTPQRVARAYAEMTAGLKADPAEELSRTFDIDHEELVLVRDIDVYSICEHHLLPFWGVAHVAYIPGRTKKVTGLSKLARLVDMVSRRPQVQERITTTVADLLMQQLKAQGAIVVLECEHMCMAMRGVRKPGAQTVTSAVRGTMNDPATRAEVMGLITGRRS